MNNLKNIQNQIEKSILANKCIIITYTNSAGKTDKYMLDTLKSTWQNKLKAIAHSITENKRPSFKAFRLDRVHEVEITNVNYVPREDFIEKVQNGTLFDEEDNRMQRRGGIVYPSSISYLSPYKVETKENIAKSFETINIPEKDGWKRAIMYKIVDGDTFGIISEDKKSKIIQTRLFGVDAPEYKEENYDDSDIESNLGLEAKVFVEDLFKYNRFCYIKTVGSQEQGAYKRYLFEILNEDSENVGLKLLENGLGFPMLGYFNDQEIKQLYIKSTNKAYQNKLGLWSVTEIYERYNNVMNDMNITEFNILEYIPDKKSALDKYLKQNPKVKILQKALQRRKEKLVNIKDAKNDFKNIAQGLDFSNYNLESYKKLCDRYMQIVRRIETEWNDINRMFDYLEQIANMIDELNLGEGEVKGNFSTSSLKSRLIYHIRGGGLYDRTIPEIFFKTEEDAKYCGFRKSKV